MAFVNSGQLCFATLSVVVVLLLLCTQMPAQIRPVILSRNLTDSFERVVDHNDVILIAAWTKLKDHYKGTFEGLSFDQCSNLESWMKCKFTSKRHEVNKSHAVIFRGWTTEQNDLPKRSPDQKWVFIEGEAPPKTWYWMNRDWEVWKQFNLTSTFTEDSDIPWANYQQVCKYDDKNICLDCHDYAKPKKKKGRVAWLVSHCRCPNHREDYVVELRKHIPVDIFGGCGNPLCGNINTHRKLMNCTNQFLHKNYKFYLSFENSLCDSYYTEKMTWLLKTDIIQIFMGTANYTQFLPEDSYLDVRDFASPKDLAEKLKYLDSNDTAFNQYIARKLSSTCKDDMKISRRTYGCRLCEYLHRHKTQVQTVPDITKFWGVKERCLDMEHFFSTHAPGALQGYQEWGTDVHSRNSFMDVWSAGVLKTK